MVAHPTAAVVTGSTKGLGKGLARALMQRGIAVVISGRDPAECEAVATALSAETGAKAIAQPCDVADPDQVQALWDAGVTAFGGIQLWINNAGLARGGMPLMGTDPATFGQMVDTNIHGTFNGSRVALAGMQKAGGGRLCNIYGGGSDGKPAPMMNGYGTTKMAVTHFTRCLVAESQDSGVIICGISPGVVITDAIHRESRNTPEKFRAMRLRILNSIADRVEVTAPWVIDKVLNNETHGAEFRRLDGWLRTQRKLQARFKPRQIVTYQELWPDGPEHPAGEQPL